MGHWLGVKLAQDGPNRDAVGPGSRSRAGGRRPRARSPSAVDTPAVSWGPRTSAWADVTRPVSASPGPTASRATGRRSCRPGCRVRAIVDGDRAGERGRAWPPSTCPSSACRSACPCCPPELYASRLERARAADGGARPRPAHRLRRPGAQRQPLLPERLRPALRGGASSSSGPTATRPSSSATSASAWPARRRCRCAASSFQDLSLTDQPRDRSRPLRDILATRRVVARGVRVGVAGWKLFARRDWLEAPAFLVDTLRELVGAGGPSRTPPTSSSTPADGPADRQRGRAAHRLRVRLLPHVRGRQAPPARPAAGADRAAGRGAPRLERLPPVLPPHAHRRPTRAPRPAQPQRSAPSSGATRSRPPTASGVR